MPTGRRRLIGRLAMSQHNMPRKWQRPAAKSLGYFGLLQLGMGVTMYLAAGGPGCLFVFALGVLLLHSALGTSVGRTGSMAAGFILCLFSLMPAIGLVLSAWTYPPATVIPGVTKPPVLEPSLGLALYGVLSPTWAVVTCALLALALNRAEKRPRQEDPVE